MARLVKFRSIVSGLTFLILAAGLLLSATGPAWAKETPASRPLRRIPDALIEPGPGPGNFMIVVEKASQTLFLYEFKKGDYFLVNSFPCTTGENKGDKRAEGDRKTPEGFYLFSKKHIESDLAPIYGILAYPMDYPNFWDQRLDKGGKGIWMHGINRELVPRDSNGCVALRNIDILTLEERIQLYDTPIIIYDKINYKNPGELNREAARVKSFVEDWRAAWEGKDFRRYKSRYARDFKGGGKDYQAWMEYKSRLNQTYARIKVDLENLRVFRHQESVVVVFNQYYRGGNGFVSNGLKRLYLRDKKDGYEIVGEVWKPFPPKPPRKVLPAEVRERVLASAAKPGPVAGKPARPELEKVRRAVKGWLASWRKKDIDKFISHYHPGFSYEGMDLAGFRDYKTRLAGKYKKISIRAEKMEIKVNGPRALVTFVQDYRSDQYRDYGLKKLVFQKRGGKWRIREESWQDMRAGAKP